VTGAWALSSASPKSTSASARRVQQACSPARKARRRVNATDGWGWAGNADGSTLNGAATVVSFVTYSCSVRRITRWPRQVTSHPPHSLAAWDQVKTQAKQELRRLRIPAGAALSRVLAGDVVSKQISS
jgi:hypothetical protein